jgi:rhodanese-related sulfurtransferase
MAKRRSIKQTQVTQQKSLQNRQKLWLSLAAAALVLFLAGAVFILLDNQNDAPVEAVAENSLSLEIGLEEAYQKYQAGAFVLDVRTPEEWEEFHAPNTTLIPLNELESRLDEVPRDREIVVVCRSGNRSQAGRDILRQAGFDSVTSLAGGLNAWRDAGYPVE